MEYCRHNVLKINHSNLVNRWDFLSGNYRIINWHQKTPNIKFHENLLILLLHREIFEIVIFDFPKIG